MIKKEFKKCRVRIRSGYANGKPVVEVYSDEVSTLARINTEELEQFIERRVRGGLFNFSEKGRKYQYITLK